LPVLKKKGAAIACVASIPRNDSEARNAIDPKLILLSHIHTLLHGTP
jgi:hypothetical protein